MDIRTTRILGTILNVTLLAATPEFAHASLGRMAGKVGARLLRRDATREAPGTTGRLGSRGAPGVSANTALKGRGGRTVRKAATDRLEAGESLTGVKAVYYRTSSGRVLVARPNRFQKNPWEVAQGNLRGSETLIGVESARFVTSSGRSIVAGHAGANTTRVRLGQYGTWAKYVAGPAAAAFAWKLGDRLTVATASEKIRGLEDGAGRGEDAPPPRGGGPFGQGS